MVCPPVHGVNPRALASGLSYVQVDKHDKLFYTTHISVDLAHHEIIHAKVGKGGIIAWTPYFMCKRKKIPQNERVPLFLNLRK